MSFSFRAPVRTSVHPLASLFFLVVLILAAMTHTLWAHGFKVGYLQIDHPWSRATPEGAKVAVGYLVVKNAGSAPDRLISVTSEIAGKTEIHEMSVDTNGVMTMRPLSGGIEIPADGEVALKPGGVHIMFLDLLASPKEGVKFKGTLVFEKAGPVDVEFAVDAMGGSDAHGSHGG